MAINQQQVNNLINKKVSEILVEITPLTLEEAMARVWNERTELEQLLEERERPFTFAAAGNIGFGKTTVMEVVGLYGKTKGVKEPLDNPLLRLYYSNMGLYSERLNLDLINVRLNDCVLNRIKFPKESLFFDRSHYEDPDAFCEVLCRLGLMKTEEKEFCQYYWQMKKDQLESRYGISLTPDLIVFLKGDLEIGWKRVQGRNRAIEVREDAKKGVGLTKEFYQALHEEYEHFYDRLIQHYPGPVLILPQDSVDVADATSIKGHLYVVKSVKEALKIAKEYQLTSH